MAASASDLVRNATPNFATTLSAQISGPGDTSMSLSSVTGLPTGTGVTLTVDATNASGVATPTLKETMTGVVSGTTISNLIRGQDGTTAQAHATGANVVMWITANLWNDFQSAFLKNHEQLHGNHLSLTDANGNNWIDQSATANAVNRLQIANAATGGDVTLAAVGSDANINIDLVPKGTGAVKLLTALYNPYKFSVYRSAATTPGGLNLVIFDTKNFDTGNNYSTSTGLFTVPVSGFYFLKTTIAMIINSNSNIAIGAGLLKGASFIDQVKHVNMYAGSYTDGACVSGIYQLSAGDTIGACDAAGSNLACSVGPANCNMSGFLVSAT